MQKRFYLVVIYIILIVNNWTVWFSSYLSERQLLSSLKTNCEQFEIVTVYPKALHACMDRPVPSRPVPSRPVPSRPVPSRPVPSRPPSRPVPSRPVPSRPVPSRPVPSRPVPSRPVPSRPSWLCSSVVCN